MTAILTFGGARRPPPTEILPAPVSVFETERRITDYFRRLGPGSHVFPCLVDLALDIARRTGRAMPVSDVDAGLRRLRRLWARMFDGRTIIVTAFEPRPSGAFRPIESGHIFLAQGGLVEVTVRDIPPEFPEAPEMPEFPLRPALPPPGDRMRRGECGVCVTCGRWGLGDWCRYCPPRRADGAGSL